LPTTGRWSTSTGTTPRPMRLGCRGRPEPISGCRPTWSGPTRQAAGSSMMRYRRPLTTTIRVGVRWRSMMGQAAIGGSIRYLSQSARSAPTSAGWSISPAMSGNGPTAVSCAPRSRQVERFARPWPIAVCAWSKAHTGPMSRISSAMPSRAAVRSARRRAISACGWCATTADGIVTRIRRADAHSSSRRRRRFEKPDRPLDRLPGEMASGQVPRIKSRLAQGCRRLASDVKPVDAKRDDRRALRELAHPLVDPVGVAPNRCLHHVLGTAAGVPGPRIDDLHRSSRVEHRLHLIDRNGGKIAELLLLERSRRLHPDSVLVTPLHGVPVDVAHERRHIGDRVGAEVEMIRMLVHVEREHRDRAGDGLAPLADALIDEPAHARQPAQQNPAGAAIERIRQRHEFAAPAIDRAEIARERIRHDVRYGAPVSAKAGKVQFVQCQRIQRRCLVLLEAADDMRRRRGGIECFELFGNRVQAREGAAIVVLIVALDEPWRDAQKSPRPAEQGCDLISHVDVSRIRRAGAWTSSCPTQPRFAAATSPRLALDRIRETTCAKPQPAGGRCAVLGRMPSWATAIEPYSCQMIYRNGKVNRLPQRRSCNVSEGESVLSQPQPPKPLAERGPSGRDNRAVAPATRPAPCASRRRRQGPRRWRRSRA